MSSNAFARSRPRVRHQRVPRTHSCDHPRFLQLVNELARINDVKKRQEEAEGGAGNGPGDGGLPTANCGDDEACGGTITCLISSGGPANLSANSNCCNASALGPQTSNGYRSLDSNNQSTSAPHDNYHQQQNNHHQHQYHHYHHQQQHHQDPHLVNSLHQDDRCAGKNSCTSFGYSKQNFVVDLNNSSDFSDNNLDLRQDENRSKRKRSANDTSSRKNPSSSCVGSGTSKRHKSSPDTIRPLSPSFTKCPICLLDSMDRDPSFTNTCFHLFCYVCIENWTKNKATCPLCRTKFTKIIYNIKSATNYEEKITTPIRRDDEDTLTDRFMLDQLTGLSSNSTMSSRNPNSDDVQFLFENFNRNTTEVLQMPQYFVNQMDPRQGESLHSFNSVTTSANFNSNVPHSPFAPSNYQVGSSSFITFSFPNRIVPGSSTAITSAYTSNTSLTNINSDPSSRRTSRSGRYIYPNRNYEPPTVDGTSRASRASNPNINQPGVTIDRHHHQHQHQHQLQNHHQHHHQHNHHRSTLDISPRQNQRMEQSHPHLPMAYSIQSRHFNPGVYPRRPYNNQLEHPHIIDMYRTQMPDV